MDIDGALSTDPWFWFRDSFERAQERESFDASRAALATVDAESRPSVRFVLVKLFDERGVAFFTNLQSTKAQHLDARPRAALAFHWASIDEQVRFEGTVEHVSADESDAYFATRPRGSQLSAWASEQSKPIATRAALQANVAAVASRFVDQPLVARPPFWGGFRLIPTRIEFWHNQDDRMHDRWSFTRLEHAWHLQRLQP